ncbi:MAG: hypothetical protein ABI743_00420 [bacterium]
MRTLIRPFLGLLALSALGCHSGGGTLVTPDGAGAGLPPLTVPGIHLGAPQQQGDNTQSAVGIYTIDVDPVQMTANAHLKESRAASANDDLYELDISQFLRTESFVIAGIIPKPTTLEIYYIFKHPFQAPTNPLGTPNGTTNRADLGISGMVLFPVDVPSATGNTYFGSGIANTSLIANADAYWYPGGLVATTGIANTFPYKVLVDETVLGNGSRIGIPNNGDPRGNYGADGWTYAEFGPSNTSWTGYGVLHQGQATGGMVALNRTAIAGSSFSMDAVIIAKYNDPRGGDSAPVRKSHRLPPETPDNHAFAYRMPHGSLDVEKIQFMGETGGFIPNIISASTLRFRVTDWDARATETAMTELFLETDGSLVDIGESGLPSLAVCIPGVTGNDSSFVTIPPAAVTDNDVGYSGGDATQDSGRPGDALFYSASVTKTIQSGQSQGIFTGMVQAKDPEITLVPGLVTVLDSALAPLSSNLPLPITYQRFVVQQTIPNSPPTVTVNGPANPLPSGNGSLQLIVTAYNDPPPTPTPVKIRFDWNMDGDYSDLGETYTTLVGPTPIVFTAPMLYKNPGLTPIDEYLNYDFTDNVILIPIEGTINWTLGPNQAPVVNAGNVYLEVTALSEPATFRSKYNAVAFSDAENDPLTFTMKVSPTTGAPVEISNIASLNNYQLAGMGPWNQVNSPITFTPFLNDPAHTGSLGGTAIPTVASPLIGTVTCALNSVGNISLYTMVGIGRRNGSGSIGAIQGLAIDWVDNNTSEAQYVIYRWSWPSGQALSSVLVGAPTAFTVPVNTTSYTDNAISADGQRYVYRVHPRCTVGGPDGPASQLAVAALQNFENIAGGSVLPSGTISGGWEVKYENAASSDASIASTTIGLNNKVLRINPLNTGAGGSVVWMAAFTPPITAADYTLIGSLATSAVSAANRPRLEMSHGRSAGNYLLVTYPGGEAMFHRATKPASNGTATLGSSGLLFTLAAGYAYNENNVTYLNSEIGPTSGSDWSGGLPQMAQFSAYVDHDPETHALVAWADGSPSSPGYEIDDVAWLIF